MNIPQVTDLIVSRYRDNILKPLFIIGERGIGKTDAAHAAGEVLKMPVPVLEVASQEESDLLGLMRSRNNKTVYDAPPWLPDRPVILFLDEVNRQLRPEVTNALKQLVKPLNGQYSFHTHVLPKGSMVVLAGNPDNGHYEVTNLLGDAAWADRVTFINAKFDYSAFHNYIVKKKWNTLLIKFLEMHQKLSFQSPSTDMNKKTPTPRAWEQIDEYLKTGHINMPLNAIDILEVSGDIGYEAATIFADFVKKEGKVVTIDADDFWKNFTKLENDIVVAGKGNRNDKISNVLDIILLKMTENTDLQKDKKTIEHVKRFILSKKIPDTFRLLMQKRINEEHTLSILFEHVVTQYGEEIIKEINKIAPK